jgi:hypothetical protein
MAKTRRVPDAGARTEQSRAGGRSRRAAEREGPLFRRGNYVLLGVSLAVIAVGFVFLAGGSITLAPILLVLGYAVLVPVAILYRPQASKDGSPAKTDKAGE